MENKGELHVGDRNTYSNVLGNISTIIHCFATYFHSSQNPYIKLDSIKVPSVHGDYCIKIINIISRSVQCDGGFLPDVQCHTDD